MSQVTRRTVAAGAALVATAGILPGTFIMPAAARAAGRQAPGFYRFKLGSLELTAINDGVWDRKLDPTFVRNAALDEVQKALSDAFLPTDTIPIPFTSLVVNTGSQVVMLDTGTGGQLIQMAPRSGTWSQNLAAAGIEPKAVNVIAISHFHPDHINGIKDKDGKLQFARAEIMVPAPEWAFWMDDARMSNAPGPLQASFRNSRRIFGDIAKDVRRYEPGKEIAPGIISIAAHGHTPGHCAFAIASGSQSMLVLSDTANNPWLFVRNPGWQAIFDMDGNMAADNRRRLLDRASADRMLVQGYHFPFPASGYITRTATGYDLVPVMWQPE
jgi:glyoxylase-like metal-dependent hydrolase (beta-lactamase superfamily II)